MQRVVVLIAPWFLVALSLPQTAHADVVEVDHTPLWPLSLILTGPAGPDSVALAGPLTQNVYFEGLSEGSANDDNGNGRDEVATRIAAITLSGTSALYGPIQLSLSASPSSVGVIEETVNNNPGTLDVRPFAASGTADSFFDLFFDLQLMSSGDILHNADPLRLQSLISHKPSGPGEPYLLANGVDLLDKRGLPSGYSINPPVPEPATLLLVAGGLLGLSARRRSSGA